MTAASKEISTEDTDVDGETNNTSPPADNVTSEVDLLVLIVLGPEADTADEEGPVDRSASIWVGCSQTGVVLPHEELKLAKLPEKVHFLGNLNWCIASAIGWLLVDWDKVSTMFKSTPK